MKQGNAFVNDWAADLDPDYLEAEKRRQLAVLRQRRARYTPQRQPIEPHGRIVIVVDDGIATGSTMTAALRALRARKPKKLVGAVAVASPEAARALLPECDAHGLFECTRGFSLLAGSSTTSAQVSDEEVIAILKQNVDGVSGGRLSRLATSLLA